MTFASGPLTIGAMAAVAVVLFAWVTGFDRGKAFYSTVLIVTASYYVLFCVLYGGSAQLGEEALVMAAFIALAVIGFRTTLWIVVAGFIAHGLFDVLRHGILAGSGVPDVWPAFCLAFDVVAAIGVTLVILRDPSFSRAPS